MKFKFGDEVTVKDNTGHHGFKIGEKVKVVEEYPEGDDPHYYMRNDAGISWWLRDEEVE